MVFVLFRYQSMSVSGQFVSPCDSHGINDAFAGDSERCFCKCAGDSDWAQKVRRCLKVRRDAGDSDPVKRHWRCLKQLWAPPAEVAPRLLICGVLYKRGSPETTPVYVHVR
jgi:hypothetical protein